VPTYRFLRKYVERRPPVPLTLRQVDPLIRQLTLYRDLIDRKTGDRYESRRARSRAPPTPPVRHGGRPRNPITPGADGKVTPIDLVSMLVSDELLRRQDRLLERRHKLARFRDPDRSLDTFDFDFNKKINRALIHELADRPLHRAAGRRALSRATRDGKESSGQAIAVR